MFDPGDDESPLNQEFAQAADNPQDFDFSFAAQREESGFANFGFDPAKAAEMRAADPSMQQAEPGNYDSTIDG